MGRCGCACPCACFMLMIVDGYRGVGCDCSRCGHWPGYEADCWRLTFQVRYWMIGVGDVLLLMSVFDVDDDEGGSKFVKILGLGCLIA